MVDVQIVNQWLNMADEDFGFASTCLDDLQTNYFGPICFHFQQATEKFLKSYIVAKKLRFEKIHDLNMLREICFTDNTEFSKLTENCIFLNSFYIESRNPALIPSEFDRNTAEKARQYAQEVRDRVKAILTKK